MDARDVPAFDAELAAQLFAGMRNQASTPGFESALDQLIPLLLSHQRHITYAGFFRLGLFVIEVMLAELGPEGRNLARRALSHAIAHALFAIRPQETPRG